MIIFFYKLILVKMESQEEINNSKKIKNSNKDIEIKSNEKEENPEKNKEQKSNKKEEEVEEENSEKNKEQKLNKKEEEDEEEEENEENEISNSLNNNLEEKDNLENKNEIKEEEENLENNNENDIKDKTKFELPKINLNEINYKKKYKTRSVSPKIINEVSKSIIPKMKNPSIKIIYIYLREEFFLTVQPSITIIEIKFLISLNLNLQINRFDLIYNDKIVTKDKLNKTIKEFIYNSKIKIRPIFLIKRRLIINNSLPSINPLYNKNYSHKVKIINYPSMTNKNVSPDDNLYKIINDFFINQLTKKDFICEKINSNEFIVSFPSSDIAFDFNRYMLIIKNIRPMLKNIKVSLMIKKRRNILKNISNKNVEKIHNNSSRLKSPLMMDLLNDFHKSYVEKK